MLKNMGAGVWMDCKVGRGRFIFCSTRQRREVAIMRPLIDEALACSEFSPSVTPKTNDRTEHQTRDKQQIPTTNATAEKATAINKQTQQQQQQPYV